MNIYIGLCSSRFDIRFKKSIRGIQNIKIPEKYLFHIIIIDNNSYNKKRLYINKLKNKKNLFFYYRVEKKRGIVHARNNFLNYVKNLNKEISYIGFIDDDCVPKSNWLIQHLRIFRKFDCDISTGPQLLAQNKKGLLKEKYNILNRYILKNYSKVSWAATNNVLFKFEQIKKNNIRFDIFLNKIGGSDQLFFKKLFINGSKIIWNRKAIVREILGKSRYTDEWFNKRSFRYGYSAAYMDQVLFGKFQGFFYSSAKFIIFFILSFFYLFLHYFNRKNFYLKKYYFFKAFGILSFYLGAKIKAYF